MRRDIDEALRDWPFEPESGELAVREIQSRDGRSVIQIRIELGVLQLEIEGRPDGVRPHGFDTYLDYLRHRAKMVKRGGDALVMTSDQCEQTDREFTQFYHRRIAWLALNHYENAIQDADHTLSLMDFVRNHGPNPEYITSHEHFRGLVLFHRTQAGVALALEARRPEEAIEAIRDGIERLKRHQRTLPDLPPPPADDDDAPDEEASCQSLIEQLQRLELEIRKQFDVPKSLRELLEEAIEREDYEAAAKIRDQIQRKVS